MLNSNTATDRAGHRETLAAMGVESAYVSAVDKGALDCTVEARTQAAAYRAANSTDYKFTE